MTSVAGPRDFRNLEGFVYVLDLYFWVSFMVFHGVFFLQV